LATTAQDGSRFQAGVPEGSVKAASAIGRWVAASTAACCSELRRGPPALPSRVPARDLRGAEQTVPRADGDRTQHLALVGGECGDEDEATDVAGHGGGVGDDRTAVGVTDQQNGAVDLVQHRREVGRVGGQAPQRDRRRDNGLAALLQQLDDSGPTGGVGERTVHQHDGDAAGGRLLWPVRRGRGSG
jgi:hypothetical protein